MSTDISGSGKISINWSSLAAVVMAVFTITMFYSSLRSEIDEIKEKKLDIRQHEEYVYNSSRDRESLEKNVIDIMKLQMKIADKIKVGYDRQYYEAKIKKFNEK